MWCRSWYQRDATSCATHHAWNCLVWKMSASWFLDSTYLIRTSGSMFILSNNQSRATRWVRDTCLIVGLLLLMIIFITASLSSKMYNCDSLLERCAFEGTWSMFDRSTFWPNTRLILGVMWVLAPVSRVHAWVGFGTLWVVPSTSMTKSHKSSAGKPSTRKPASNDMISDSAELWDTDVCFLHIQRIGANVRLPKMHKTQPDVDFESSRSPAKSESWSNSNRQCWAGLPTWQHWRNHSWNECRKLIVPIVWSDARVHFLTDRASLLTDHRMSGRPIRAKYKLFNKIWEQTSDNSPLFSFFFFWFGGRPNKDEKLWKVAASFCLPILNFEHVFPSRRTTLKFLREVWSHPGNFSVAPAEIRDSNILLYCPIFFLFCLHSRWVHPKKTWSRNDVCPSMSTSFINFFHIGAKFCFFPSVLMSST